MRVRTTIICVLSLLTATAACFKGPPTKIPAPKVKGRQLVLAATGGSLPDLILEAAWELRGDRYCVREGAMRLVTRAGVIPFDDATLCVTIDPVSIVGEARVAVPGLGLFEKLGLQAEARKARIEIALGSQRKRLAVGNHAIATNPYQYYVYAHYQDGLSLNLGNLTVKAPQTASATVVFAPQEPLVYLAGAMTAPFVPAGIEDVALGLSPQGRLAFAPKRKLYSARGRLRSRVRGHLLLAGSVPLTPHPVTVSGEMVVDIDGNDDGRTILSSGSLTDLRDFQLGLNGSVALGYKKKGFDFSFEVGNASLVFDARPGGGVYFAAGDTGGMFAGTPLAIFRPSRSGRLHGYFQDDGRVGMYAKTETRVLGFKLAKTELALDNRGIRASGSLRLPAKIGRVDVRGQLAANGQLSLRGRANLRLAKLRLFEAAVTLSNRGVAARGRLALPGLGKAVVSGSIYANGKFSLAGRATLRPAGIRMANARVAVSPRGADISGGIKVFGTGFSVRGRATAKGFSLTGKAKLNAVIFKGDALATISNRRGIRIAVTGRVCLPGGACIALAGFDVDTRGRICPVFPVAGKKCVQVFRKKR